MRKFLRCWRFLMSLVMAFACGLGIPGELKLAFGAPITFDYTDVSGEGFFDNSAPDYHSTVGGNSGATLGAQRRIALESAATAWGNNLSSQLPIVLEVAMNPIECTPTSSGGHMITLGSASVRTYLRKAGAQVWDPIALANAQSGSDYDPSLPDIVAQFNSLLGSGSCAASAGWYYGLDGQVPYAKTDFAETVKHEIAHGLGFSSSVSKTTGEWQLKASGELVGMPNGFDLFLADRGMINKSFSSMADGERLSAIESNGNLVWTGAEVAAASGHLTAGKHFSSGEVLMYAPSPVETGSSVSHFDESLYPDELLEPLSDPMSDDRLTKAALRDIGWEMDVGDPAPAPVVGNLENPGADSYKSGIGIISGWVCAAGTVLVTVDGTSIQTAYGTERTDTVSVCGDSNNGFGALYNWNRFGDGPHTAIAYADGVEFGRANFTVTTFGTEFMNGIAQTHEYAGRATLGNFPEAGKDASIRWDQSVQNFVIESQELSFADQVQGASSSGGNLENPGPAAYKSGIGIISGWVCSANEVVVYIDGVAIDTAYGTERTDTASVCGDSNNGFAALYNWNRLGDGGHQAIAYADGVQFAWANFIVTTFGVEMLTGVEDNHPSSGRYIYPNFPTAGVDTRLKWDQSVQNFVIWALLP